MSGSETRVLVVDDQRNIRVNLKIILEDAGYRVDEPAIARRPSLGVIGGITILYLSTSTQLKSATLTWFEAFEP